MHHRQALTCSCPWVLQEGRVGGNAQKGGSGTFHRLQGHESHLQVAACGSRDLKTRYIPRNTSVPCHVFQGTFRNKQSHLPKSAQKASSLDPTASVLHSPTHEASNSTISTTKFLSVFILGGGGGRTLSYKIKKKFTLLKVVLKRKRLVDREVAQ